jgi:hypothetical protein
MLTKFKENNAVSVSGYTFDPDPGGLKRAKMR